MTVNFYNTLNANNEHPKTLTLLKTATVTATKDISVLAPVFLVNKDNTLLNCNYIKIVDFNKYYFCDLPILKTGGLLQFNCSIDAVETHFTELKNCKCVVVRNGGIGKPTIIKDNMLPVDTVHYTLQSVKFPVSLGCNPNDENFVIQTLGG